MPTKTTAANKSKSTSTGKAKATGKSTSKNGANGTSGDDTSHGSNTTTDHEEIRRWAEERGAKPACVKSTGKSKGDVGMIRLDFPGFSGEGSLQEISWEDWFKAFDENKLALVYQEELASGEPSNFNKLVSRQK